MNNWQEIYKSRLTTADEAVKHIPNNCRVFFGHAANEPPVLVDALVKNYMQYENVEICHWVPMGKGEYCKPEMAGHFRYNGLFLGGVTRKCVEEGRGDYTPFNYHQSTRFFSDGTFPIDVALVSVTPPDKNGYVNLGVSVVCGVLAAVWCLVVIALGWIWYRPVLGILLLAAACAIIWYFSKKGKEKGPVAPAAPQENKPE